MKLYFTTASLLLTLLFSGCTPAQPTTATSEMPPAGNTKKTYTMADVSTHNTPADCWTVIRNTVYNLTGWINNHPGGPEKIEQLCGLDGTEKFVNQHGGKVQQEEILATFKIGVIVP